MKRSVIFSAIALTLGASAAHAAYVPAPGQAVSRNDPNGVYCREYTQDVTIGGAARSSYGTACQQPDGAWKIITTDVPQEETRVEYVSEPQYISPPQYVVPPVAYYEPRPYYAPYPVFFGASYSNYRYRDYRSYYGPGYGRDRGGYGRDRGYYGRDRGGDRDGGGDHHHH